MLQTLSHSSKDNFFRALCITVNDVHTKVVIDGFLVEPLYADNIILMGDTVH